MSGGLLVLTGWNRQRRGAPLGMVDLYGATTRPQAWGSSVIESGETSAIPTNLADQRFWRIEQAADYRPLNALSRHRMNTSLIAPGDPHRL